MIVGVLQCNVTFPPLTAFSYGSHLRPRVFVAHAPLIPKPGKTVTIRLFPDVPAGVSVVRAVATLGAVGGAAQAKDCLASASFACDFTLPATPGLMVYGGRLELDNGQVVSSRASYRFTVQATAPVDALVEVRVPITQTPGLADAFRVDVAWMRDPAGYALNLFEDDLEKNIFEGVLTDPIYRWRDNQLGFYAYTREGLVTSYYSGRNTRCGQNPWPKETSLPSTLDGMEVLGVMRRGATGVEGQITGTTSGVFRDCAGSAVRRPALGTFSATAGLPESPFIAKHELGHAAFRQGDEYWEATATRQATPAATGPLQNSCCCLLPSGGGGGVVTGGGGGGVVTGGGLGGTLGGGSKRCVGPGGALAVSLASAFDTGLPACDATNSNIPIACWADPEGGCPSLAGTCVAATAWLGSGPPAGVDTTRPNVFGSQQACVDARALAAAHAGVEDPPPGLGACRLLCSQTTQPCPCGATEFWIVDVDPLATGATPPDAMGAIASPGEDHGGTCQWCVESTLCVRWQRALGDDAQTAWDACRAPPKSLTGLERLLAAIGELIRALIAKVPT